MGKKDYDFAVLSVDISDRYPEDIKEICGGRIYGTGFYSLIKDQDNPGTVTVHIVDIMPLTYDEDIEYIIDYFSVSLSDGPIELFVKENAIGKSRLIRRLTVNAKRYESAVKVARKYIMENPDLHHAP